ncbi:MAG: hypothetical protein V1820_03055 [archaeon]
MAGKAKRKQKHAYVVVNLEGENLGPDWENYSRALGLEIREIDGKTEEMPKVGKGEVAFLMGGNQTATTAEIAASCPYLQGQVDLVNRIIDGQKGLAVGVNLGAQIIAHAVEPDCTKPSGIIRIGESAVHIDPGNEPSRQAFSGDVPFQAVNFNSYGIYFSEPELDVTMLATSGNYKQFPFEAFYVFDETSVPRAFGTAYHGEPAEYFARIFKSLEYRDFLGTGEDVFTFLRKKAAEGLVYSGGKPLAPNSPVLTRRGFAKLSQEHELERRIAGIHSLHNTVVLSGTAEKARAQSALVETLAEAGRGYLGKLK